MSKTEGFFTLAKDDRFHCVMVSEPIRFDTDPPAERILAFYAIRRAPGTYDIFNCNCTYVDGKCSNRKAQAKRDIPHADIDREVRTIAEVFSMGMEMASGIKLEWHTLDLSMVEDRQEQISRLHKWGRVGVDIIPEIED